MWQVKIQGTTCLTNYKMMWAFADSLPLCQNKLCLRTHTAICISINYFLKVLGANFKLWFMLTKERTDLSKLIIQASGVGAVLLIVMQNTLWKKNATQILHTSEGSAITSQFPSSDGTLLLVEDPRWHSGTIKIGFRLFCFSHSHHQDPSA